MKKQIETVKTLIGDKKFYKIRFCNYYHQLMQFKEKLISSKNKFNKIRQINEKLQQKVNKLKIDNKIISFQRRKYLFRLSSFVKSIRHAILDINTSISIKKSTKHFDFKSFNNRRKDFKQKE